VLDRHSERRVARSCASASGLSEIVVEAERAI
jgi:hypothetical protein